MHRTYLGLFLLFVAGSALAELRPLAEDELQEISGQAGLSISASLNFAANPAQTRCPGGCGTRVAIQPANSSGFIVLDNIQGTFGFEGLSFDIVTIDSGYDGDGAAFNASAMRLGLTDASFNNARVTLAGSNSAASGGVGFQQTDLLTYQINGDVRINGNLYLFAAP
jgi:CubicO group peptidase (beta-lactamase class C family)